MRVDVFVLKVIYKDRTFADALRIIPNLSRVAAKRYQKYFWSQDNVIDALIERQYRKE